MKPSSAWNELLAVALCFIVEIVCVAAADGATNKSKPATSKPAVTPAPKKDNVTQTFDTDYFPGGGFDSGMMTRTLYVLVILMVIIVLYFGIRGYRMRQNSKSRKYGMLATGSNAELAPLDHDDDDDEDMTLYEVNADRK